LSYFEHPYNIGLLDVSDKRVATAMVGARACGEVMQMQIMVEKDTVIDAKVKTYGSGFAIAANSLAASKIIGKSVVEIKQMQLAQEIIQELELPSSRTHSALLAEEAVIAAVDGYILKLQQD